MPGVSFSPFNAPPQGGQGMQKPGGVQPVQDAIRMLSFRMPSTVGASSPAPQGLMGGQTALGGQLSNPLALNWLRALFGGQAMPGAALPGLGAPQGAPGGMGGGIGRGFSEGNDVTGGNPPAVGSPFGGGGPALPINFGFDQGGGGGGSVVPPGGPTLFRPSPLGPQIRPNPSGGMGGGPSPYAGFNNFGADQQQF